MHEETQKPRLFTILKLLQILQHAIRATLQPDLASSMSMECESQLAPGNELEEPSYLRNQRLLARVAFTICAMTDKCSSSQVSI